MFTLTYPANMPPAERIEIDHALERANGQVGYRMFVVRGRSPQAAPPDDAPAQDAARLDAYARVVDVVCEVLARAARRAPWSAVKLQEAVTRLVDQLVVQVDRAQESPTRRPRTAIEDDVHARPSWAQFRATLAELDAATDTHQELPPGPGQTTDDRPLLTIQEVAERLNVSEDTVTRMGAEGKLRILSFGPKVLRVQPAEVERLLTSDQYLYRR